MNTNDIVLGRCYLARLSKSEMPVRLERNDPKGGWIARSLEHGRVIRIRETSQLIGLYENNAARQIASEATPHRRSRKNETIKRPPVNPLTEPYQQRRPAKKVVRPLPQPMVKKVILVRLNLLDAAHRVLTETKRALTTREIVAACVEKGYWTSSAATPWQTLNAALNRDLAANGSESRFVKTGRGLYSLR